MPDPVPGREREMEVLREAKSDEERDGDASEKCGGKEEGAEDECEYAACG